MPIHSAVGRFRIVVLGWSIVAAGLLVSGASAADDPANASASMGRRTKIYIGFYINAIRDVDWQGRRFCADVYWWMRYSAPDAAADRDVIEAIEFVNADLGQLSQKNLERKEITTADGTEIYIHSRTTAYFHFEPDFHKYPFDSQTLPIVVEHETLGADSLTFVDDVESYSQGFGEHAKWGLASDVSLPGFSITGSERTVSSHRYETQFGDPSLVRGNQNPSFECSRMTVGIQVRRIFTPYLVKIMVPLCICLLLPYLVFFIEAVKLDVAAGLTVTSLLACVAIQLTVVPGLPAVGYVVTSDMLFYLAYLLSMLAMAQTVWTYTISEKNPQMAHRLDVLCRFAYPAIFVIGFAILAAR